MNENHGAETAPLGRSAVAGYHGADEASRPTPRQLRTRGQRFATTDLVAVGMGRNRSRPEASGSHTPIGERPALRTATPQKETPMATPMTVRDLRAALFAVADQEAEVWVMSADQGRQIEAVEPMLDGVYILLIDPDEMPLETALFEAEGRSLEAMEARPENTVADGRGGWVYSEKHGMNVPAEQA